MDGNLNLIKDEMSNVLYIWKKYGTDLDNLSLSDKKALSLLSEDLIVRLKELSRKLDQSINKEVLSPELYNKMYCLNYIIKCIV
jgi:hypothetical protein